MTFVGFFEFFLVPSFPIGEFVVVAVADRTRVSCSTRNREVPGSQGNWHFLARDNRTLLSEGVGSLPVFGSLKESVYRYLLFVGENEVR